MEKIIFLDCDGVISTYKAGWHLDPEKLELLERILNATGAKIVVSSSWRSHTLEETLEGNFKDFPFKDKVIGVTPRLQLPFSQGDWNYDTPERGLEISAYLNSLGKEVRYVILDDDDDFLYAQKDHIVRTDSYRGISAKNVVEAINILNEANEIF